MLLAVGCAGDLGYLPEDGSATSLDAGATTEPADAGADLHDAGVALDAATALEPDAGETPPDPPEPEPPEPEPPTEPDEIDETPGAREARASYRVLHWNIAGGKEHDCRPGPITDAVLRLVSDRQIQLIGLNEVCRSQYDSISEALRRRWGKSPSATFSAFVAGGRVGNAIFSRADLTGVTRQRIGEDQYGDRNLLCARIAARPHLRFCSTHLSPGAHLARAQLERVHTQLEQWWDRQRDTVILSGDFNLEPNDRAFDPIYSEHANHPAHNPSNRGHYRELDDADPAHCLGYGERSVPRTGGGPCVVGRKIDLIFARGNRIVEGRYGLDALNIPSTCGGVCSDHRPVAGHVRVRALLD